MGEGFDKGNAVELVGVHEAQIGGKIEAETGVIGSGGPVWRVDGSSKLLHGIVTAGPSDGSGRTMYTTPIYYAQNMGFSPRTY